MSQWTAGNLHQTDLWPSVDGSENKYQRGWQLYIDIWATL